MSKSIGNINNLPDFTCENATINSATITNLTATTVSVPNMVSSSSTITDNCIVRGDGGSRGVQSSGITIDDSNNVTGANSISTNSVTGVGSTHLELSSGAAMRNVRIVGGTDCQLEIQNSGISSDRVLCMSMRSNSRGRFEGWDYGTSTPLPFELGSGSTNTVDVFIKGYLNVNSPSNQLVFQPEETGTTTTLNVAQPASNRIYTIPDVSADANFVMSESDQTVNGVKTMTNGVKTNSITSISTNDSISIDANGTGQMLFNTIVNNGCLFGGETGGLSYNWAIKTVYNGITAGDACPIMGTSTVSSTKVAVVGSNNYAATLWTPLYIQPVTIASAYTCFGDEAPATALASGSKIYVKGNTYSTGDITTGNNLILKKASTTSGTFTASYTGNRTHTFQDQDGTVAHLSDIPNISGGITTSSVSNTSDLTIQSTGGYTNILSNNDGGLIVKSNDDDDFSLRITNDTDTHGISFRVYDDTFNSEMRPIINGVTNTGTTISGGHSIWLNPYNTTDKVIIGNLKESDFGVGSMKLAVEGHILCDGIYTNGTLKINATSRNFKLLTGTTDYTTVYDTTSITLEQLAERVRALQYILGEQGLLNNT